MGAQWSGGATTRYALRSHATRLLGALPTVPTAPSTDCPQHCPQHLLDGDGEVLGAACRPVDRRKGAIGREVAPRPEDLAIVAHALALGVVRLARAVVDERAQRLRVASTRQ